MNEPFQFEKEVIKKWILAYFDRLQEAEMELILYRSMIEGLKVHFADVIAKVERTARKNPSKKAIDRAYDKRRREVIDIVEKAFQHQASLRLLQEWKPIGPIN